MTEEPRTRTAEVRSVLGEMAAGDSAWLARQEGLFSSFGMLIVDATLSKDREALTAARDGIRGLRNRYARSQSREHAHHMITGRLTGLLDAAGAGLDRTAVKGRKVDTLDLPEGSAL